MKDIIYHLLKVTIVTRYEKNILLKINRIT